MKNVKRFLASVLVAVSVFAGGMVASIPAQADNAPTVWGTSVYLTSVPQSHQNAWIKSTNMLGTDEIVHVSETATSVRKFCPPGINYYMQIRGPNGTYRNVRDGACYTPTNSGLYTVWLYLEP